MQTFSLNAALGPRTTDKGYVLAPGIGANLEFEDSVGGGVSQLSTTLYNATFFGCYQDVTHTVHALVHLALSDGSRGHAQLPVDRQQVPQRLELRRPDSHVRTAARR